MKVRIVSDGTPFGTRVMDAETGELLDNVTGVTWESKVHAVPNATITTILTELDVVTEAQVLTVCPQCKREALSRAPQMERRARVEYPTPVPDDILLAERRLAKQRHMPTCEHEEY